MIWQWPERWQCQGNFQTQLLQQRKVWCDECCNKLRKGGWSIIDQVLPMSNVLEINKECTICLFSDIVFRLTNYLPDGKEAPAEPVSGRGRSKRTWNCCRLAISPIWFLSTCEVDKDHILWPLVKKGDLNKLLKVPTTKWSNPTFANNIWSLCQVPAALSEMCLKQVGGAHHIVSFQTPVQTFR